MRVAVAAAVVAALALAGCGAGKTTTTTVTSTVTSTRTVTVQQPSGSRALGAQDTRYFGQIVSITQVDPKRDLLVLKPEFFLVGVTANVVNAQQQGTQCAPLSCPGVPDDHLVVPAGAQKLTFVLPAKTTGTVLTTGDRVNSQPTTVTAAQLAALVAARRRRN